MNSKLNVSLRERRGLVYNVESNLTSYTDTGAFCIYFGTDIEDMDTCLKLTYKELKRMRDVKMTSSQLAAAKSGWPPIILRIMRWAWRKLSCITISTNHPSLSLNV